MAGITFYKKGEVPEEESADDDVERIRKLREEYIKALREEEQAKKEKYAAYTEIEEATTKAQRILAESYKLTGDTPPVDLSSAHEPTTEEQAMPRGQRPTMYNRETGQWEEVDPKYSDVGLNVPLGEPRSGGGDPRTQEGGALFDAGPWQDRGAQTRSPSKLYASNEPGVPVGYNPPEDEPLPEGFVLDAPDRQFGIATTFGYNDPQDNNGMGAWGTPTNNPNIIGVSLPRKVLRGTFGDEDMAFGALVEVTNPRTGKKITAPIVDKGPADWVIQRQGPTIDLTEGARVALGGTGKDPMEWKIIGHEEPLPEGFVLDEDEPLPEGFVLDQPTPSPSPKEDYIDVPGLAGSAEVQVAEGMTSKTQGMLEPGNIDLSNRPIIKNPDGTISTERSFSIEEEGKEVLIPLIVNGKELSQQEAIDHYRKTGEHMGKFKDAASADAYAEVAHNRPMIEPSPSKEVPAKKEVGLIESAKRGVMSSSIGIGEAVNRYAYSPVVHGISEAVQAVAPGTEVAKKAKEFDEAFFKHTVEEPAAMRKQLEFDSETEKRTVLGGRTLLGKDIGKAVDVASELAELGGALVPDIATAALTQGATAAKAIPTAFKTAAPTILNAIKSYAPQLAVGARSFMLPAMKSGMDAAKQAKEQDASEVDQNAAFLTNTLKTMAMASVPMATESRLATRVGRVTSRAAQGGALAGATDELERTGSNIVLGENRPFSPVESLKQVVTGGTIAGPLGRKGVPARKLQQAKAAPSGTGIGITAPGTGKFAKAFPAMKQIGASLKQTFTGIKPWTDFKQSLLGWHGRAQRNTQEVRRLHKTIVTAVPDVTRRDGITNYIQADGDLATLQRWEAATSNLKLKLGYRAAQNLTTTELAAVKTVQDTYKDLLKRARHYGIDMNEVQNYVTQMWDLSASGVTTTPTTFSSYFKFAKPRTFTSFFKGEQAGFKPKTKDIAEIIATYTDEMNNAINNRMFVEEMGAGKGTDGRPLLHPAGLFYTAEKSDGGKTYLSFPDSAKVEAKDYEFIDRPALKKWMWKGQDDAGNPFFQKSDMLVHPEAATQLKRAISGSGLRKWYRGESKDPITALGKGTLKFLLDEVQPTAKATMLSFSPFHLVQEGIHGFGHTVNPLSNIPRIDLPRNAGQMDAARHGLVLGPTRANQLDFMDGVGMDTKNLVTRGMRKFGGLKGKAGADFLDGTTHWLFEAYIPGLKYKTYEHILERNSKRFADDIGSGKVNIDQIKHLSAEQANAAYGHLNYADLGRSPNLQHFFQIAFLAPDFFEARARFVGQSARVLVGQKGGMEQFRALAVLAATQWIGARIFNTLNNDDPLWEYPFEVKVGNKLYGVRSVPEDLFRLAHDQRAFISGRISPIFGKAVQEGLFGINWRGEQVSELEALKDIVFGIIPLPMQTLTRDFYQSGKGMTISPMEQLWAASGVRIHRFSPITEIHRLSGEWQEKHAPQTVTRVAYPISKYAQLRYALEDGDKLKAQHEFQKLRKEGGLPFDKVAKGFETSIKMPFTGSLPNDARFYQSLDYKDKAKFKAAMERRSTIINRFRAWVSPSDKDAVTEAVLMSRMLDAQANDEL